LHVVCKLFINHVLRSKPENLGPEIRLREVEGEDMDWIYLAHDMKNWEFGRGEVFVNTIIGVSGGIC
jgi:hypothetical protein